MDTKEAARILNCDPGHVTRLIRNHTLKAEKIGPRFWDVDPKSVEEYRKYVEAQLEDTDPAANQPTSGITCPGADSPQGSSNSKILEPDPILDDAMRELQEDNVVVSNKSISLAHIFLMLGQFFLNGIQYESIFPTLIQSISGEDENEKGIAANEAMRKLMFKLRTLELVRDENRQGVRGGYTVIVTTSLGARVIRSLRSKG